MVAIAHNYKYSMIVIQSEILYICSFHPNALLYSRIHIHTVVWTLVYIPRMHMFSINWQVMFLFFGKTMLKSTSPFAVLFFLFYFFLQSPMKIFLFVLVEHVSKYQELLLNELAYMIYRIWILLTKRYLEIKWCVWLNN